MSIYPLARPDPTCLGDQAQGLHWLWKPLLDWLHNWNLWKEKQSFQKGPSCSWDAQDEDDVFLLEEAWGQSFCWEEDQGAGGFSLDDEAKEDGLADWG